MCFGASQEANCVFLYHVATTAMVRMSTIVVHVFYCEGSQKKQPVMKHTIDDIIDIAGGRKTVAYQMNLHSFSVQRWARTGIPAKYWG